MHTLAKIIVLTASLVLLTQCKSESEPSHNQDVLSKLVEGAEFIKASTKKSFQQDNLAKLPDEVPLLHDATRDSIVSLGSLKPFWRYSAALGPYHEQGQALFEIPEYVTQGDFPYHKRPYPKEVPFADHLSLVRILGGFVDKGLLKGEDPDPSMRVRDLAYRDKEGNIQARFELLESRLRPYLEHGYTDFTIVLDNVPWDFPESPSTYGLGQNMPPKDLEEWRHFIVKFCQALKKILPGKAQETVRFRVGTEMNGVQRFGGNQKAYEDFFAASVAAVREVFPKAEMGFYNISGAGVIGIAKHHNVNSFKVAKNNLNQTNPYTDEITPAVDFVSFSRYFSMGMDLQENVSDATAVWEEFETQNTKLMGVSREIHEFGVAPFGEQKGADKFVSQESGALAAASTAIMTFHLLYSKIDRLWHWAQGDIVDIFRDRKGKRRHVFTGVAWFYQIMEAARGGQAFLLTPLEDMPTGTEVLGLASNLEDHDLLIIASYRRQVDNHESINVQLALPSGFSTNIENYQFVFLNRETATHRNIRNDLAEAGLLVESFQKRPDRLGSIRQMSSGIEGERLIDDRLEYYQDHYVDSLTLKDENSHHVRFRKLSDGQDVVEMTLSVPEVFVMRQK